MKRIAILLAAAAVAPSLAIAQSPPQNPAMTYKQVPTVGQWQNWFAQKQDTLGYVPINKAGDQMVGRLVSAASTASSSGFAILPGVAPLVPKDGDVWTTSSGLFIQINGSTVGPVEGPGVLAGQNKVYAGPASGGTGASTFRSLVGADLPNPGASSLGGVKSLASTAHNWINSISTSGVPTVAQPAAADLSDGTSGTGAVVLNTSPSLVTPNIGSATAAQINKVAITAPATSATLTIADSATLTASSTTSVGRGQYLGDGAGSDATAGNIGEFASGTLAGVAITSGAYSSVGSTSLTAGDWDVQCSASFTTTGGVSYVIVGVNTAVSAPPPANQGVLTWAASTTLNGSVTPVSPLTRIKTSSPTTVYCVASSLFGSGTVTASGYLRARRVH